ncbi:hypothetical protein [Hyphococcus sp.]|uniref:hypothetical protein n=1 Tax=Hyphococcus sp. TaxID=2038636 RepID=UPI003CCB82B5
MKLHLLAAAAGMLSLAACGGAPDPTGELEIVGDRDEINVGEAVNLRWTSQNTSRVYIALEVDGREPMMINSAGFEPSGTREFQVEASAFAGIDDDDITVTFKLQAPDDDEDEYETLDEETIEVNAIGAE